LRFSGERVKTGKIAFGEGARMVIDKQKGKKDLN
jgi:hypothetical protein